MRCYAGFVTLPSTFIFHSARRYCCRCITAIHHLLFLILLGLPRSISGKTDIGFAELRSLATFSFHLVRLM